MKESTTLLAFLIIGSMLTMAIPPVTAWEYSDTWVNAPQTDNLTEAYGPMADHVQIILYNDELAEFSALALGQIDVTDWPVDSLARESASVAVVDTGVEYGMFYLDMRMNNDTRLYRQIGLEQYEDLGPNPAFSAPFGNPMADVWLRRAVAACINRPVGPLVLPLYTAVSNSLYPGWANLPIDPNGGLSDITYVLPAGPNIALANSFLNGNGYLDTDGDGVREYNGMNFQIEFYVRSDDVQRMLFGEQLYIALTANCQLDIKLTYMTSAGARIHVVDQKKGHMYTAHWGLTIDPDHLYYLFHINNYFHPGRPANYMYYPGCRAQITVPYTGWQYNYTNVPSLLVTVDWGATPYQIDFSDYDKTYNAGDKVWEHPQNYWSWEMMIANAQPRAIQCAYKSQEAMAYFVCGEPIWASRSYTAFSRFYNGPEPEYHGKRWKGVANQKGFGVWSTWSFYNMHTTGDTFGDGNMTIRWGFRQPTLSLNPIYAEWSWDWNVLNQAYDSMIRYDPYQNSIDLAAIATSWDLGTWDTGFLGLGVCTKVTFNLRHDAYWSDGAQLTASDVVFSWGGRKVPGSIANLLFAKGYPPAYWDGQIADMLSVAKPDPWTVIVYLDVYCYFGLHSMSGWNIILPEHVWKPIIETGDPTNPWNQPCVCSGPWKIRSTAQPTVDIWLDKNPLHYNYRKPIDVWTRQSSMYTNLKTGKQVPNLGGVSHWLNRTETNKTVDISVFLHNYYIYETGPFKPDVYDGRTVLDGEKTVTVWKWTGPVGSTKDPSPSNLTQYTLNRTLANNVPFACERCITETELYPGEVFDAGWYSIRVEVHISSLEYWDGIQWVVVNPPGNPFYCQTYTYNEFMIVTSYCDISGRYWKPCPPAMPYYQGIPDLRVDLIDLAMASKAFGSYPGASSWNPDADVTGDSAVDGADLFQIAKQYGWRAGYAPHVEFPEQYDVSLVADIPKTVVCQTGKFTVYVSVVNVTNLYAYDIRLRYNTTLVEPQFSYALTPPPEWGSSIYTVPGYIAITGRGTVPLFSGNATLAVINFTAKTKGNFIIDPFDSTLLEGIRISEIPYNVIGDSITVSYVGDITGTNPWDFVPDGIVDGNDGIVVSRCFGSSPTTPPPMIWNINCDITNDGIIDGSDYIIINRHFGEKDP